MREFILLLPELTLLITLTGILISETGYHGERVRLVLATALVGLGGAFVQALLAYRGEASRIFGGALCIDAFSLFFKLVSILIAALVVVISARAQEIADRSRSEYCALIIASALAVCVAASASNLLLIFLSLQFINILGYFLAAYNKRSVLSTEAAVKYLVFGVVSGVLFLYGAAVLFASTNTLDIYEIHRALVAAPLVYQANLVSFLLIFLALSFQLGAFPMSLWFPDVLEGAPTPSSAILSLVPRVAGLAVATRLLVVVFSQPSLTHGAQGQWQVLGQLDWTRIVTVVAGLTMLIGSLLAFMQASAKRMVAYLVLAETGALLMGLLVLDRIGMGALFYCLLVEVFALVGIFYVLSLLYDHMGSDRLSDFGGVPGFAVPERIFLILFLFCLIGIPPLPGFIGKFTLIGAAISHQQYFLAVVAIASTAINTAAGARLSFGLLGGVRGAKNLGMSQCDHGTPILTALLVSLVLIGIFAEFVLDWAGQSLRFILW